MGRVEGKVAFITGAARGQGRSHAVRLAQEGADIIAVDVCHGFDSVPYDGATEADLAETVKMVESLDRRIVARQADVRDLASLQAAVDVGLAELGHIDVVIANAGIASFAPALDLTEEMWQDMIDINLTGLWKTVKAAAPSMVERGQGGSIILTSSVAGIIAFPALAHYTAAKHGVVGLMRSLAIELAPAYIRVNSINPTTVDTPMIANPAGYSLFMGGLPDVTREQAAVGMKAINALPIPWVEAVDVSNAVLYLASEESRYVTGTTMVIDAGAVPAVQDPARRLSVLIAATSLLSDDHEGLFLAKIIPSIAAVSKVRRWCGCGGLLRIRVASVRLGLSWRLCRAAGHLDDGGPLDHGGVVVGQALVVAGAAAPAGDPGVGRSTTQRRGRTLESLLVPGLQDDLDGDAEGAPGPVAPVAVVGLVGPDQRQAAPAGAGPLEQHGGADPVLGAGRGDHDADEQAEGVDQEVALAAADLLVAVVAAGRGRDDALGGLVHRLGVDDPRRRLRSAAGRQRMRARRSSTMRDVTPSSLHRACSPRTVRHGGKSAGIARHLIPLPTR